MERQIFRKKSIDRISSPEELNDYIKVANPGVWLMLSAVIVLLIGVCVWGVFGKLDTTLQVSVISTGDSALCYISEEDIGSVAVGMPVAVGDTEYTIESISSVPVQVDDSIPEYLRHLGGFALGEWVYVAQLDSAFADQGVIMQAWVIVERVAPMSFIFN